MSSPDLFAPWRASARHGASLFILFICLAASACVRGPQGPPPPDVSASLGRIDEATQRLASIEAVITRDLARMTELERVFFDQSPAAWAPPFPLDAFRHTAMSCFNQPVAEPRGAAPERRGQADEAQEQQVAQTPAARAAEALGVRCTPRVLPSFRERIESLPEQIQTFATTQLGRVDELRVLRAQLERRTGRLDRIVAQAREEKARWSASLRALRQQVAQRRSEYGKESQNLRETMARLDQVATRLTELEARIARLEAQAPQWSARAQEISADFTYHLVWVGVTL